jgi:hypothetical protein
MTAAGAGTTVRPIFGLLATATFTPILREIHLWNTTVTACTYRLVNFTGGTAGAGQAERRHRRNAPAAVATAFGLWTADATVDEDTGFRIVVPAAIGGAGILTFGGEGVEPDLGSTDGLGLVPVGTGQVCEVCFVWDE